MVIRLIDCVESVRESCGAECINCLTSLGKQWPAYPKLGLL